MRDAVLGLIQAKPRLIHYKTGHFFAFYRRSSKMSFYALSSGRSLAGLPVVGGMEKKPCFSGGPVTYHKR